MLLIQACTYTLPPLILPRKLCKQILVKPTVECFIEYKASGGNFSNCPLFSSWRKKFAMMFLEMHAHLSWSKTFFPPIRHPPTPLQKLIWWLFYIFLTCPTISFWQTILLRYLYKVASRNTKKIKLYARLLVVIRMLRTQKGPPQIGQSMNKMIFLRYSRRVTHPYL